MSDVGRSGLSHFDVIRLQLQPIATGSGSRATYSEPSAFSRDGTVWVGGGAFSPACSLGFPYQFPLSGLLGSCLDEVSLQESFALSKGFPLGCKSWLILQMGDPSPTPSFKEPVIPVFRGGQLQPLHHPSCGCLSHQGFCVLRVSSVGVSLLLFVVCWRGESPRQVHSIMMLLKLLILTYLFKGPNSKYGYILRY